MPIIIPINYIFDQGSVVLRSAEGSKLEAARRDVPAAAFEIDGVNENLRLGWNVVVRGDMQPVTDLQELAELQQTPLVTWAPGEGLTTSAFTPRRSPAAGSASPTFRPTGGAKAQGSIGQTADDQGCRSQPTAS